MDDEARLFLIESRMKMPFATVPHLIEQMKQSYPEIKLNNSTVYRFLHQQNMMHPEEKNPADRRKFEAELPNDLWQSDVMHGPLVDVNGKQQKAYLIAIIDDHSRLIVYARFYLSEGLSSYLDALENGLARRGVPRKLYTAPANLKDYFRKVARRTVAKDRTITLDGRLYEGPVALIGKRVELLYHQSSPEQVEVRYRNKSFGMIRPVDIYINCRVKRDKNNNPQMDPNLQKASYQGGKLWGAKHE